MQIAVLLHNIRSAHNVGSIFRTADAAGVSEVLLSGYTPSPLDRFGRAQKDIVKTALGAEISVRWQKFPDARRVIDERRTQGWRIVGVEQDARSRDYRSFSLKQPTLFVFGNEVRGLSPAIRTACDELIEIPMHGAKESLNVAVAAGIILFAAQS